MSLPAILDFESWFQLPVYLHDHFTLLLFMPLSPILLQTGTTGALESFSGFVITSVNIIFLIVLALGLINTVRKFLVSDPGAMGSLDQLIVGVIIFLGFSLLTT